MFTTSLVAAVHKVKGQVAHLGYAMLCNHQILSIGITWKWKQLISSLILILLNQFPYLSVSVPNFTILGKILPVSEK